MDSDESYETTSEVFREGESEPSSSSSQASVNRNSSELRELYASTFSGPENATIHTMDNQIGSLTVKLKEQTVQIQSLKEERIKYLEQITQLYTALEKRESELVEFIQLYEQKANDVAQYMQEVQSLLAQLTTLFSDQLAGSATVDEPVHHTSSNCSSVTTSNSLTVGCGVVNGQSRVGVRADNGVGCETTSQLTHTNGPESSTTQIGWDQRGRALLHALSASVATASARNKQATLPRNAEPTTGSHLPIAEVPPRPATWLKSNGPNIISAAETAKFAVASDELSTDSADGLEVTVSHLPPFCWSPEHVIYWLSEYACLPGGCVAAAKRVQLDGKQLTALSGNKADKLLCLSDAGLRRKFQLALEDLRVHGPPGISRFPGPSHIRPQWVCDVWLRQHLGLSQLAPLFAVRRIDGRLLASLAIYKRNGRHRQTVLSNLNSRSQLISNPTELMIHPNPGSSLPGTPLPMNGSRAQAGAGTGNPVTNRVSGSWRGVSRKEFHRILLGLSRDTSAVGGSSSGGISGADLPPEAKLLLGKKEACSLRTGIELLRLYNFNLELLEEARREVETKNDNLLVWTNERVAKWLKELGLKAFTEGIDGTGLHGAYMVLDPTFDLARLMKHLHLPASVATAHRLDEELQALLKPARQREGIIAKQHSIFRRRSVSRPGRTNLMQRSITSGSPMDYSSASTPHLLAHPGQPDIVSILDPVGPQFESYPKTMPTNSSFIAALSAINTNLSRTLNGGQVGGTPTKGLTGGISKRGKFKAVTISGDLSSGRFTRVFSRSKPSTQSTGNNAPFKTHCTDISSPEKHSVNTVSQDDRSSTLVRRCSAQPITTDTAVSPIPSKFSTPTSSPGHMKELQKSTPSRGPVKPSEAPMVDPFAQNAGRTRIRVMLGQTPRMTTAPGLGNCSPQPGLTTQSSVSSSWSSSAPERNNSDSVHSPILDSKTSPSALTNPGGIVPIKLVNTTTRETWPDNTTIATSSSSPTSHSNNTLLTKPLSDSKRVLS